MTEHPDKTDLDGLAPFFAAARAEDDAPRPAFMARLRSDALAALPRPAPETAPQGGLGAALFSLLGGWSGATAMAACTVAGVVIGMQVGDGALTSTWTDTDGALIETELETPFLDLALAEDAP